MIKTGPRPSVRENARALHAGIPCTCPECQGTGIVRSGMADAPHFQSVCGQCLYHTPDGTMHHTSSDTHTAKGAQTMEFLIIHRSVDGAGITARASTLAEAKTLADTHQAKANATGNPWCYSYVVRANEHTYYETRAICNDALARAHYGY